MEQKSAKESETKHHYAVMHGHGWTTGLGQVLIDEYQPFIDQGFELDRLGNHFLGGQGFREDMAGAMEPGKAP